LENQSATFSDAKSNPEEDVERQAKYEQTIKIIREKEQELSHRTELLENMVRMLTNTLAGARLPETPSTFLNISPNFQNTEKEKNERPLTGLGLLVPGYPKAYLREALELVQNMTDIISLFCNLFALVKGRRNQYH